MTQEISKHKAERHFKLGGHVLEIIRGKIKKPFNIIMYGHPGVGKSTWAKNSPEPIFIGAEEIDDLDVDRGKRAETWLEFEGQVASLIQTMSSGRTLVIDTLDSVEKLLHRHILSQDTKSAGSMAQAHGGYGRAYERAESEFLKLRQSLQQLRDRGVAIILLAHSHKTLAIDTVLGLQYDTHEMSLHKKAQSVFVDWASAVLFATSVNYRSDDDNSDKVFAIGQGERVVLTEKRPGFLAKNRYNLPYEMPLDFGVFYEKYNEFYELDSSADSADIYQQCFRLLVNISDDSLRSTILSHMDKSLEALDARKLIEIKKRIEQRIGG